MSRRPLLLLLLLAVMAGPSAARSGFAAVTRHVAPPRVGEPAPPFTLRDQNGRRVSLAAGGGAKVVLVFYRGYW